MTGLNIKLDEPLVPPRLIQSSPLPKAMQQAINQHRQTIQAILAQQDPRLLCVVGPCSVHDPGAMMDYASRLMNVVQQTRDQLVIVMRVYLEKPRTIGGWKGYINDPSLDDRCDINEGIQRSRELLLRVNELGLPVATEFIDPLLAVYTQDLVSWGAIGARTSESQIHRQLVSGLTMPVGFKNATSGDVMSAINSVKAAAMPNLRVTINPHGQAVVSRTTGNAHTHLILRGGTQGPNYHAHAVNQAIDELQQANCNTSVMIDCSHDNSGKDYRQQARVLNAVQQQVRSNTAITGVMLESHLQPGKQPIGELSTLRYGQSITDGCMGWEETESLLLNLADTIKRERLTQIKEPLV